MKNEIARSEVRDNLALLYRRFYDDWHKLTGLAKEAIHDGDEEAYKVITYRAVRKSDFMDGIKGAAEALGIGADEFMDAVNADRPAGK